jgi:GLPGLI family protein
MMKKFHALLAIAILFIQLSATAQEGEPVLASVVYEFIHVNDTSNRDNPIREEMALYLGQNTSKYFNNFFTKNQKKAGTPPPIPNAPTRVVSAIPIAIFYGPGHTSEILYQHTKENKLNKIDRIGFTNYLIELPLPKINWKVDKETRSIGGYTCQKAVGDYAGRTYTAWFAPDLPFHNGPWKLSGLPGLILEANDSKNEVLFQFKEISKDTTGQTTGSKVEKLVTVDEKAFVKARETWINDPVGVCQSQQPGSSATARLIYLDSTGKVTAGENAIPLFEKARKELHSNNPIELKQ